MTITVSEETNTFQPVTLIGELENCNLNMHCIGSVNNIKQMVPHQHFQMCLSTAEEIN